MAIAGRGSFIIDLLRRGRTWVLHTAMREAIVTA
jgi:hypothetical protein